MQGMNPPAEPAEGMVHFGDAKPRDNVNVCGGENGGVVEVTPTDIQERMAEYYGGKYRELVMHPMSTAKGEVNAATFMLQGTPPKGHAVYYEGNGGNVWFYDTKGFMYEHWTNVEIDF